jgi:hypothetical protein
MKKKSKGRFLLLLAVLGGMNLSARMRQDVDCDYLEAEYQLWLPLVEQGDQNSIREWNNVIEAQRDLGCEPPPC